MSIPLRFATQISVSAGIPKMHREIASRLCKKSPETGHRQRPQTATICYADMGHNPSVYDNIFSRDFFFSYFRLKWGRNNIAALQK